MEYATYRGVIIGTRRETRLRQREGLQRLGKTQLDSFQALDTVSHPALIGRCQIGLLRGIGAGTQKKRGQSGRRESITLMSLIV